jgi:hypothetical protein
LARRHSRCCQHRLPHPTRQGADLWRLLWRRYAKDHVRTIRRSAYVCLCALRALLACARVLVRASHSWRGLSGIMRWRWRRPGRHSVSRLGRFSMKRVTAGPSWRVTAGWSRCRLHGSWKLLDGSRGSFRDVRCHNARGSVAEVRCALPARAQRAPPPRRPLRTSGTDRALRAAVP